MRTFQYSWNNSVPRYQHWSATHRQENPYRQIAAPMIAAAAHEAHVNLDVSPALALYNVFLTASVATQALADVEMPGHGVVPISLICNGIADSGGGKTKVSKTFFTPLQDFQVKYFLEHDSEIKLFEQEQVLWDARFRALQQNLLKAYKSGECATDLESAIREHMVLMPKSPRRGNIFFEDATAAAFHYGVYLNGVSAFFGGAEGGTIFMGDAFDEPQKLNSFYSGESVRIDRKTGPSFTISDMRVTVGIFAQPGVLKTFLATKRGKKAMETGFFARQLFCDATNYQRQPDASITPKSWVARDRLHVRLLELMNRTFMSAHIDGFQREVIRFSPEAAARWAEERFKIELCRGAGGMYEFAPDHAARLPENIARVAAVIHLFEGKAGDIDIGTLEAAITIVYLSSLDYLNVFVPPPREFTDAIILDEWFDRYRKEGQFVMAQSYGRGYCPNKLRREDRYLFALNVLCKQRKVVLFTDNGINYIHMNPQAIPPHISQLAYVPR